MTAALLRWRIANQVGGYRLSNLATTRAPTLDQKLRTLGLVKARALIIVALSAALTSCITPSIPIPPPEPSEMTFAVDATGGFAVFSYAAEPNYSNAVVYVFNRNAGTGIIATARADGSVGPTAPFPAHLGDNVAITFETDEVSVTSCVVVRDGSPSAVEYCTR